MADPRDAVVVPRDTSGLSEATRQWLDGLPLVNTPDDVLARYRHGVDVYDIEAAEKEKERESLRSAALVAREDAESLSMLRGEVAETVTAAERFAAIAAMTELAEHNDTEAAARRALKLAERRAAQREQRIAELERELAAERSAHQRADYLASDRLKDVRALVAEAQRQRTAERPAYPPYQRTWR